MKYLLTRKYTISNKDLIKQRFPLEDFFVIHFMIATRKTYELEFFKATCYTNLMVEVNPT